MTLVPPIIVNNKLVVDRQYSIYNLNNVIVSVEAQSSSTGLSWVFAASATINSNSYVTLTLEAAYNYYRAKATAGGETSVWGDNYVYDNISNLLPPTISTNAFSIIINNPNNINNVFIQLQYYVLGWQDADSFTLNANSSISKNYSFTDESIYQWRARLWSQSTGTSVSDWAYYPTSPTTSPTSTPTITLTPTRTPTVTPTVTPTITPTATPTNTPTQSPAPGSSATPTPTKTPTASSSPTPTPTRTPNTNTINPNPPSNNSNIIYHKNCLCQE